LARSMWPIFARGASGGWARLEPGVVAYFTGAPVTIFNGVIVTSSDSDIALVGELLDAVGAEVADLCLQTRPGAHAAEEMARSRGMVIGEREPLMLLENPSRVAAAASVDGLTIRRLRPEEVNVHLAVMADGFGAPVDIYAPWFRSDLLSAEGVHAYVGSVDERDVVTGLGIVADDHVGVFDVAVLPEFRRRGYGAALTARTVLDGIVVGARRALLMSSEMGLTTYKRLGFRTLEMWSYWESPETDPN
jgi:GNAT superfamily N-acetyltransferase